MANTQIKAKVQRHRESRRLAGLRPVQIWVPDTRRPDFAKECRRQCLIAAEADMVDMEMQQFTDATLTDLDGWTE